MTASVIQLALLFWGFLISSRIARVLVVNLCVSASEDGVFLVAFENFLLDGRYSVHGTAEKR